MTSAHRSAFTTTLRVALLVALLVPTNADAAGSGRLGWSNAPRWRLPAVRPPDCPSGYAGNRALVQVASARCKETGPQGQTQPRPTAARPSARPATQARPEPARAPTPVWTPAASPAGPDATALMAMNAARCHDYLREREVEFVVLDRDEAPEVAIPVRLRGPIAGVAFTIPWTTDLERDAHAIWDCRLVAAVVPLAEWLHDRGITEVQYFSALRRGKIVQQKPKSQHNLGLALDLYALRRGSDAAATVEDHYPRRTLRRCPGPRESGPGASPPRGAPASELLLGLVCVATEGGLVHTLLTPDHDRAHANHLHLDLKAGQSSPADPFVSFHGL
ncbi:hypothetical protein SAMN02745121_00621 [Nannocystis exedens]|uniref:Extensin-like protein C-terminus n=1 Tax=Nannocystis exedens TaxID=54 RepID=A0A1I1TC34_9BACT|nr:hypothetical protein [Nannocystis exedens]PCC66653.1 hypothetical protein NAEX_09243 [Nannocystis exedens]SFD56171.1 hypothetical protein SAMN02745121_00621 [Nannocystis exedens]